MKAVVLLIISFLSWTAYGEVASNNPPRNERITISLKKGNTHKHGTRNRFLSVYAYLENEFIYVQTPDYIGDVSVSICNNGNVVFEEEFIANGKEIFFIPISSLANGAYQICVTINNDTYIGDFDYEEP